MRAHAFQLPRPNRLETLPARHRHTCLPPDAGGRRHLHPRAARWYLGGLHELFHRVLCRWPGARRHPWQRGHAALWPRGQARCELHADHGGIGGRHVWHGGAHPGAALAWPARGAGLGAGAVLLLHRHVRRRDRYALHPGAGGPHAADLPVGFCRRQHPARPHRSQSSPPFGRQTGRRHGRRLCGRSWQHQSGGARGHGPLRLNPRGRHDCGGAHRHSCTGGRAHRLVRTASSGRHRLARVWRSLPQDRLHHRPRYYSRRRPNRHRAHPFPGGATLPDQAAC